MWKKQSRYCYREVLPLTAMVVLECSNVGLSTLFKAASTKGMSYQVFIVYSFAISAICLTPLAFFFHSPSRESAVKKLHVERKIITTEKNSSRQDSIKLIPVPFDEAEPTEEHDLDGIEAEPVVEAEDSSDEEDEDFIEPDESVQNEEDFMPQFQKGLEDKHTCENDGQNNNSMVNAKWIAGMIEEDMRMHHMSFTARDIIKLIWHRGRGLTIASGSAVAGRSRGVVMGPLNASGKGGNITSGRCGSSASGRGGGRGPFPNAVEKRFVQIALLPPAANVKPPSKKRKVFYPPAMPFLL
ncbi:hypothetical protein LguiB_028712 [Lonicera macranthoides]